jgi:hypothetical protein
VTLGDVCTLGVVVLVAMCLIIAAATGAVNIGLMLSDDLYARAKRNRAGRLERRRLINEAKALRYARLTSEHFDEWCELPDDDTAS